MVVGLKDLVAEARRAATEISPERARSFVKQVRVLDGGLNAWADAGLPTEEGS